LVRQSQKTKVSFLQMGFDNGETKGMQSVLEISSKVVLVGGG
jgi:hypothetical protein